MKSHKFTLDFCLKTSNVRSNEGCSINEQTTPFLKKTKMMNLKEKYGSTWVDLEGGNENGKIK